MKIPSRPKLVSAPLVDQQRGRDAERDHVGERVEVAAQLGLRLRQAGDAAVGRVEEEPEADRERRLVEVAPALSRRRERDRDEPTKDAREREEVRKNVIGLPEVHARENTMPGDPCFAPSCRPFRSSSRRFWDRRRCADLWRVRSDRRSRAGPGPAVVARDSRRAGREARREGARAAGSGAAPTCSCPTTRRRSTSGRCSSQFRHRSVSSPRSSWHASRFSAGRWPPGRFIFIDRQNAVAARRTWRRRRAGSGRASRS